MSGPSAADLDALHRYATALADGVDAALAPWVERCIVGTIEASGGVVTGVVRAHAADAGRRAASDVGPRIRDLLALDIDDQRTGPLALLRTAVSYPTQVLRDVGVPPVDRDPASQAMFPEDDYDLTPASFADLDPDLGDVGIAWGAAKAHVHLARRRT